MSRYYPPGVTGNEPEIVGSVLEDKCEICIEQADEETTVAALNDGVCEINGVWVCEEHRKELEDENVD